MASWTVNDIWLLLQKLTKKTAAGNLSAEDFFYHWNAEQSMYFQDEVGRWQAKSNGKEGINTGLLLNETILADIAAFTIPVTLPVSIGRANKPDDFEYRMALRINGKKVSFIRPDQITYVNDSVIDPPSAATDTYYATEYEGYYTFLPASVTSADLDYLASPTDIKWGFSYDTEGRQIYNPIASIQPKWANSTIITITKRTLANIGISFKDKDFENYGRNAQITGD